MRAAQIDSDDAFGAQRIDKGITSAYTTTACYAKCWPRRALSTAHGCSTSISASTSAGVLTVASPKAASPFTATLMDLLAKCWDAEVTCHRRQPMGRVMG